MAQQMMSSVQTGAEAGLEPSWTLYTEHRRWGLLVILFLVAVSVSCDQAVIAVLLQPIKGEFHVSDTMLGLLAGICFTASYAVFGFPVARSADRGNRRSIITGALALWSLMAVLCGLAHSFGQLALAWMAVGAAAGGAIPAAQSLIVDYFPLHRRATAIAIFTAAATVGYMLALGAGGYIAATKGWRAVFLAFGAPGLILALLTHLGLAEPRLQLGFPGRTEAESLRRMLARLASKRTFIDVSIGCILYFFVAYGALLFIPAFLVRVQHVPLAVASVSYGTVVAVATMLGTVSGGWLADRLSRRDLRWLAWLPAGACLLAGPLFAGAFALNEFRSFLLVIFPAFLLLTGGMPPVFAAIHAVCGNRRRAMAVAIVVFTATLLGGSIGPLVTGRISDALTAVYGQNGLRYGLMMVISVLVFTAGFFYLAGRAMPAEFED